MAPESDPNSDWSAQQADRIVDLVDTVKGYTTDKAIIALRAIVFGLVIAVLAIAAILMLVTVLVRMADAYLPIGGGVGDAAWAAHLFIGSLLSILGLGSWMSRRNSTRPLKVAVGVDIAVIITIVCYGIIQAFI